MMKITIAQINTIVGAIDQNTQQVLSIIDDMRGQTDLIVFPELTLTGYPLNDLVYEMDFLRRQHIALEKICEATTNVAVLLGAIEFDEDVITHDRTCRKSNTVLLIQNQRIIGRRRKSLLPNYDVFHEQRYFTPAKADERTPLPLRVGDRDIQLGIQICEDLWDDLYDTKVSAELVHNGAEILINCSASPFEVDKFRDRHRRVHEKVEQLNVPFVYCNLVGGQDELIFDGYSFAVNSNNQRILQCNMFETDIQTIDMDSETEIPFTETSEESLIYRALILGIRDYFHKNGLTKAILGLSGGIDSALVCALAVDALGAENVMGLSLPSKYSSDHSVHDAVEMSEALGIAHRIVSIEPFHYLFEVYYADWFGTETVSLADENVQARLRGLILMLFSNQSGRLLLSTGNKTEIALGYSTLYGDMNGALTVIGDLSKTRVYKLAHFINDLHGTQRVPQNIIDKRPSAELANDQFDPFDYDRIAPLVDRIIEGRLSKSDLRNETIEPSVTDDIFRRMFTSEFKRNQAAIILKISSKAFGYGRLYPITNHYRG